jgi:DNA polymerase-1
MMELDEFDRHFSNMINADRVAVDTETTGIEYIKDGRHYLQGISFAYRLGPLGIFSGYTPLRHCDKNMDKLYVLPRLEQVFRNIPLVFHNRKFDLHSLYTIGLDLGDYTNVQDDTMVMAQLAYEESPSLELDWLSKKYLGDKKLSDTVKPWGKAMGWDTIPADLMAPYAAKDAELTLELREKLLPILESEDLLGLLKPEQDFGTMLYRMEQMGVGVNQEFCTEMLERGLDNMGKIESVLSFNPSSTKDLGAFFVDELKLPVQGLTPGGKPSFNKKAMEAYEELLEGSEDPTAKLVLEYRGWQKATSSLYKPMLERVSNDGFVRPNFRQTGTKTGRLSCAEPNLQQVPRKSEKVWNGQAKRSFNAGRDSEFILVGYDYSQLELRLAAAYGNEQRLIDEFARDDADPFTAYSSIIGVSRQETKTFFYSNLYGAGVTKIAYVMGRPEEEVRVMHDNFVASIPGIRQASKRASDLAKSRRFVRYWTGRRRHFPYGEGSHKAFNSILQGGAAELVKHAMLRMRDLECDDLRVVLQVHDEIVFRMRASRREEFEPQIIERMVDFPQFGVRFAVEGKVWNE